MAVQMRELLGRRLDSLRYEPTTKRIRVSLDDQLIADTRNAALVWEPRRVVPTYAVPVSAFSAHLARVGATDPATHADVGHALPTVSSAPILDPRIPFAVHTCAGSSFDVVVDGATRAEAAFRADDPDLAGYIVLDFGAFDWLEEDEPVVSHPHDPFHRIDILHSSRHVRLELDGRLLAESSRPLMLFETSLPVRFYLPAADIAVALEPSDTVTYCAYKGRASYFSVPGGPADIAWSYPEPLHDAAPVKDLICFFDEHVDVVLDGERSARPVTPWSD
jgi:uncharacterized protein (DUF427 family)